MLSETAGPLGWFQVEGTIRIVSGYVPETWDCAAGELNSAPLNSLPAALLCAVLGKVPNHTLVFPFLFWTQRPKALGNYRSIQMEAVHRLFRPFLRGEEKDLPVKCLLERTVFTGSWIR